MSIFTTADHHLGHRNVIRYCGRPFQDVDEMDAALISKWNEVVEPHDTVYHLGDLTLSSRPARWLEILRQLNGCIHLILGNHDNERAALVMKNDHELLMSVRHYARIKHNGHRFVLLHYAMRVWHGSHRGAFHLYGHSHGSLQPALPRSMDVGVDSNDYQPINLDDVIKKLNGQRHVALDHHGAGS